MEFLIDLWLPIVVSTIVLFFASFAAWVILPHHFGDKKKLAHEQEVMNLVKDLKIPPGNYMFPYADNKAEQGSAEFQTRYQAGPRGCLDVYASADMRLNMVLTVLFFFVTSAVIGYITHFVFQISGPDGETFMNVLRVAGTIGMLTHGSSGVLNNIWFKRRSWTDVLDGIVFGVLIGLIFAALWPYAN